MEISSEHLHSKTVRTREPKFWEKVHFPPFVTCHVSSVICHMSYITCHMSWFTCHMSDFCCFFLLLFLDEVVKLVGWGSAINGATPSSFVCFLVTQVKPLYWHYLDGWEDVCIIGWFAGWLVGWVCIGGLVNWVAGWVSRPSVLIGCLAYWLSDWLPAGMAWWVGSWITG